MQLVYKDVIYTKLKLRKRRHARIKDATHELAWRDILRGQWDKLSASNLAQLRPSIFVVCETRNLRPTSSSSKHSKNSTLPDPGLATSWRRAFTPGSEGHQPLTSYTWQGLHGPLMEIKADHHSPAIADKISYDEYLDKFAPEIKPHWSDIFALTP